MGVPGLALWRPRLSAIWSGGAGMTLFGSLGAVLAAPGIVSVMKEEAAASGKSQPRKAALWLC